MCLKNIVGPHARISAVRVSEKCPPLAQTSHISGRDRGRTGSAERRGHVWEEACRPSRFNALPHSAFAEPRGEIVSNSNVNVALVPGRFSSADRRGLPSNEHINYILCNTASANTYLNLSPWNWFPAA